MKALVLWSSRTGNTKAVGEAIYEALPCEKEIFESGRQPNDLSCYDSQGRVHSFHIGKRNDHAEKVHPMTPERLARLQEAEKHPNETDFKNAAAWALKMLEKASL